VFLGLYKVLFNIRVYCDHGIYSDTLLIDIFNLFHAMSNTSLNREVNLFYINYETAYKGRIDRGCLAVCRPAVWDCSWLSRTSTQTTPSSFKKAAG